MEKHPSSIFSFSVFLIKTIVVLIFIGIIFSLCFEHFIIYKSETTGASKINRIISLQKKTEIPILGSSRAEGNFSPTVLGSNFYNYGIPGTQSNIWLYLLEQELRKDKTGPILLNFDLIGMTYSDGEVRNYLPNWNKTKNILTNEGEFYYNIPVLKYFGQFEKYFASFIQEKINLTIKTDNGAVLQTNKLTKVKFKSMVAERLITKTESEINEELSLKFISLITSTKRKIILIIGPYHYSCFNTNANYSDSEDYLLKLRKYDNLLVLDLRDFIKDDKMFMNTTHLNYNGALKFSKRVKELIHQTANTNNKN